MNETVLLNMSLVSKQIQLDLVKGELKWDDSIVQYFIPCILYNTEFDWLELIAENNLVEEDEKVVKNFLEMVKSLIKVTGELLCEETIDEMKDMFGGILWAFKKCLKEKTIINVRFVAETCLMQNSETNYLKENLG